VLANADCSTQGTICIAPGDGGAGSCEVCGGSTQQCCAGNTCLSGGCCQAGKCIAQGKACPTPGDVCYGGICRLCGTTGSPCCATGSLCAGVSPNKGCCDTTDLCVAASATCADGNKCNGSNGVCP
jgi:hypothetical protein